MDSDVLWMARSIVLAREMSPANPFAAIVVNEAEGVVVAEGYNHTGDNPIWHGEMDAIAKCGTRSDFPHLTIYTTAEPCPMCQSAILWAGIRRVVFGVSIADLIDLGWEQIEIASPHVAAKANFATCEISKPVMRKECLQLFHEAVRLRAG